jgi:hypothetical protein
LPSRVYSRASLDRVIKVTIDLNTGECRVKAKKSGLRVRTQNWRFLNCSCFLLWAAEAHFEWAHSRVRQRTAHQFWKRWIRFSTAGRTSLLKVPSRQSAEFATDHSFRGGTLPPRISCRNRTSGEPSRVMPLRRSDDLGDLRPFGSFGRLARIKPFHQLHSVWSQHHVSQKDPSIANSQNGVCTSVHDSLRDGCHRRVNSPPRAVPRPPGPAPVAGLLALRRVTWRPRVPRM